MGKFYVVQIISQQTCFKKRFKLLEPKENFLFCWFARRRIFPWAYYLLLQISTISQGCYACDYGHIFFFKTPHQAGSHSEVLCLVQSAVVCYTYKSTTDAILSGCLADHMQGEMEINLPFLLPSWAVHKDGRQIPPTILLIGVKMLKYTLRFTKLKLFLTF